MALGITKLGFLGGSGNNRSLSFSQAAGANGNYLYMTGANFGSYSSTKIGISLGYRPTNLSLAGSLYSHYVSGVTAYPFVLSANEGLTGRVSFNLNDGSWGLTTTTGLLTANTFVHIYVELDTTQATANDRIKLYINGVQPTFTTRNNPNLNATLPNIGTGIVGIGKTPGGDGGCTGQINQPALFSGTLPGISGVWNGRQLDVTGVSGLYSYLKTTASSTLENDEVISTNWTNVDSVTKSMEVPS